MSSKPLALDFQFSDPDEDVDLKMNVLVHTKKYE